MLWGKPERHLTLKTHLRPKYRCLDWGKNSWSTDVTLCHSQNVFIVEFFSVFFKFKIKQGRPLLLLLAACRAIQVLSLHSCSVIVTDRSVFQLHFDNLCNFANSQFSLEHNKNKLWCASSNWRLFFQSLPFTWNDSSFTQVNENHWLPGRTINKQFGFG